MRAFLKLTWTLAERGERHFVVEDTIGGGDRVNGSVLIGPFATKTEAEAVLLHRHRQMGAFFQSQRQDIEAMRAEVNAEATVSQPTAH